MKHIILLATLTLTADHLSASDWAVRSPPSQAALVELYTSQGCSSCPPADNWLAQFLDAHALFDEIVPVAYHVTYWGYLGWRDPFGQASHDQRHREQAARVGAKVYTPGVFLQGREWRNWRQSPRGPRAQAGKVVGVLSASAQGRAVEVRFAPEGARRLKSPKAYLTYLRKPRATDVRAGENRGQRLRHQFIATPVARVVLTARDGVWAGSLRAAPPEDTHAVAVWVVDGDESFVQATGGFVDEDAS